MSQLHTPPTRETIDFDQIRVTFDSRVLRPRGWTASQSHWASELLDHLVLGSVLELCAGAGQIGLLAVAGHPRRLVSVDVEAAAAELTAFNAAEAGLVDRVEVRVGRGTDVLDAEERFALVIADPPWVRQEHTGRFPEDPLLAIDGGLDGLVVARECVAVAEQHLLPGGAVLLQLGTLAQVEQLAEELATRDLLRMIEIRHFPDQGVLVRLDPARSGEGSR